MSTIQNIGETLLRYKLPQARINMTEQRIFSNSIIVEGDYPEFIQSLKERNRSFQPRKVELNDEDFKIIEPIILDKILGLGSVELMDVKYKEYINYLDEVLLLLSDIIRRIGYRYELKRGIF